MPVYQAPTDDMRFVLYELLEAQQLSELPGYEEATQDLLDAVLEEGAKICQDVLFPLNMSGDEEGCVRHDGLSPRGPKDY